MKKKFRSILFNLLGALMLIAATPIITNAAVLEMPEVTPQWNVQENEEGDTYLYNTFTGEELIAAFTVDEKGNVSYINLEEHADYLNNNLQQTIPQNEAQGSITDLTSRIADLPPTYTYKETRTYTGLGTVQKVSQDYKGPATISVVNAVTTMESFSGSLNATAEISKKIKAGASFTWNTTTTSSTSISGAMPVPTGKTGYIQFTPYLNVSVGNVTMHYWVGGVYNTLAMGEYWESSPIKIGKFTDGLYEMILR